MDILTVFNAFSMSILIDPERSRSRMLYQDFVNNYRKIFHKNTLILSVGNDSQSRVRVS
jgi:hypothetical protein